jgi:hypothetical protein
MGLPHTRDEPTRRCIDLLHDVDACLGSSEAHAGSRNDLPHRYIESPHRYIESPHRYIESLHRYIESPHGYIESPHGYVVSPHEGGWPDGANNVPPEMREPTQA